MTGDPPHVVRRSFTLQSWRDVVFLHWRVDPDVVAPLLPPGTEPDLVDGTTWIGVVGLRMTDLRVGPVPYPSFLELNIRLYSCGTSGQRAVVFRAMEASEPVFAAASRSSTRLPYTWAAMRFTHAGRRIGFATRRRLPRPSGTGLRFEVEYDAAPHEPSATEAALTARWSLHQRWYGPTLRWPVTHPAWPLHRGRLVTWHDEGLLAAVGLPTLSDPPESVLYSPATTVRFGRPSREAPVAIQR